MLDFIARPLGMLLKIIFDIVNNYGLSIIVFTVLIKIILLPINIKQTESTKRMNEINPKMKEIQEKYKNDKEKCNQKLMELYKQENYNPASGCLPALLQMPILFALFIVLKDPIKYVFINKEAFDAISKSFVWLTNLGLPEKDATLLMIGGFGIPVLAVLSAVTTYIQMKMIAPKTGKIDPSQQMMSSFMPVMFGWITYTLPAGLALYWIASNIFTIVQQYFSIKVAPAKKEA